MYMPKNISSSIGKNNESESTWRKRADKVSAALGAYDQGDATIGGEPIQNILEGAHAEFQAMLENDDQLLAKSAEEQLRRMENVLKEIRQKEGNAA